MKFPRVEVVDQGLARVEGGDCPMGAFTPIGCLCCPYGHMTDCHYPYKCEEAECSHWQEEAEGRALSGGPTMTKKAEMEGRDALIQEGRNQVLYLLLAIGDENVAHDHWHPDRAEFLYETRQEIVHRLRTPTRWPEEWPDFERYTHTPG